MNEVLNLPKRKQDELAGLLKETSLSAIINASKIVADRGKFLAALDLILIDTEMKKSFKERSQLHQILADDNTWLFGEEYSLSVSDRSLTEVLRKHREALGEKIVIDEPVKHPTKKRGIVDLMLSRALRRHRADELEHLIVELKAPKVVIGQKEITQIKEYAFAVMKDPRFKREKVNWVFWLISDDMDDFAENEILEGKEAEGTIHSKNNCIIQIKTWSQVLEINKARLQFFREKLEHQASDEESLKFLKEKYDKFLTGVVTEEEIEKRSSSSNEKQLINA